MNIFENNPKKFELLGMYIMDKFPVFQYTDIQDSLNVAIFGESVVRENFFKIAVSACHMQ